MKKTIPGMCVVGFMIFGALNCAFDAQEPPNNAPIAASTRAVSFSLSWAGITPGTTKDHELIRKYGKGVWLENVGHTGGRAYITSDRSIVLIAELHEDEVDSITVASSSSVSDEIPHMKAVPIVPTLPNRASFGGVHLGDRADTVYKKLGPPNGRQLLTWEVDDSGTVDLAGGFSIVIVKGQVVAFIMYYGD